MKENKYIWTSNIKIKAMSVKSKYQSVLDLGEKLNIKDGNVTEEGGVLKIKGQAATP